MVYGCRETGAGTWPFVTSGLAGQQSKCTGSWKLDCLSSSVQERNRTRSFCFRLTDSPRCVLFLCKCIFYVCVWQLLSIVFRKEFSRPARLLLLSVADLHALHSHSHVVNTSRLTLYRILRCKVFIAQVLFITCQLQSAWRGRCWVHVWTVKQHD